jgi:hypothetical protein
MGSFGFGNNADLGAFMNRVFPEGLDLGRCQIKEALGVYVADPTDTFRAGMLVARNSSGLVVKSNGLDVLGVAKWNHTSAMLSAAVDEAVVLTGTTPSNLKRGNVSNVRVASGIKGTGTVYVEGTDYTVNTANGTVTRTAASAIPSGSTNYVTYTFQIPESDLLQLQGKNFWNSLDEVSMADNRVTVITDAELLYTTQYDTSKVYSLTGSNSNLYAATAAGKEGLFTSDPSGSAKFVGRVFQVPTAADPFLGLRLIKNPVAG